MVEQAGRHEHSDPAGAGRESIRERAFGGRPGRHVGQSIALDGQPGATEFWRDNLNRAEGPAVGLGQAGGSSLRCHDLNRADAHHRAGGRSEPAGKPQRRNREGQPDDRCTGRRTSGTGRQSASRQFRRHDHHFNEDAGRALGKSRGSSFGLDGKDRAHQNDRTGGTKSRAGSRDLPARIKCTRRFRYASRQRRRRQLGVVQPVFHQSQGRKYLRLLRPWAVR